MADMYNTNIPALLLAAIEDASDAEARQMFDDADFCSRKLLEGLMSTGRLLSAMGDMVDPQLDELRGLGDSIAVTAELVAGFNDVVESYRQRCAAAKNTGGRHA